VHHSLSDPPPLPHPPPPPPPPPPPQILVRLYFDGNDEIAYHTDGRAFLGKTPTIASLSLGETASFQMRKMTHVWPCSDTPNGGVDASEAVKTYRVGDGDLLVMLGKTQVRGCPLGPDHR
jgi:alkylated DNA repair dioxygenase AlkB